ncbi:transposase family protein [Nodosilinea sp. LEGE 07298]|uniref:transposase family protein n=1 Tax=Nodosilinea sp. LEGE 07298 TaxID=2777970 RepID=UPI001880F7EC|nr:transposase family protein [Nodosilinea sp. LEGE 07298]MBE9112030.1 transposase family protein [Nodosilinea sp. LEGE 07298]
MGLPGIDVESYSVLEAGLILDVETHTESACCPRCGTVNRHLHQNHWHLVRHLPISHYRQTWLCVNRRQFKCAVCGKPFSEDFDFMGARRSYSDRYAESVVRQVIHSDTVNVARQQGLSEDIVWSMVEYVSAKKLHRGNGTPPSGHR